MKIVFVSAFAVIVPKGVLAGDAENITACIEAVNSYAGKEVDEFDVRYTGRFLGFSSAEWNGVKCEVSLGAVRNLTVDSIEYVYDGFAGREAKAAYEGLERETREAILLLESRVQLLERRLNDARSKFQMPKPDIKENEKYIREGISRATGVN